MAHFILVLQACARRLPAGPTPGHVLSSLPVLVTLAALGAGLGWTEKAVAAEGPASPHIILVMADDMGWGQTGYRGHPVLKTPHLDAMAAAGLRLERFYAGGPVCSPTRASVLTGRSPDRSGVLNHGYALRHQEKTISQALKDAGYVTGHFGKWHLNGFKGAGAPILPNDPYHPGTFGFDEWVSATNFFDQNPLLGRNGQIEEFQGDSSDLIVDETIRFLKEHKDTGRPMFAVVWYGSPHSPYKALEQDKKAFAELDKASADHYGELVAMDRSIGTLRAALREMGIAENTLLVFNSDNGGLPRIQPGTVGELRGLKGTVYEGGIRVPAIIEWPAVIEPRVTHYPASTMDLFPTIADIVGLSPDVFVQPLDGISLKPLLTQELAEREKPIPFRYRKKAAWIDGRYKLVAANIEQPPFELYDLESDPRETTDLREQQPERYAALEEALLAWNRSVEASFAGQDYPEGRVSPPDPESQFWFDHPSYAEHLPAWLDRWEFKSYIERVRRRAAN